MRKAADETHIVIAGAGLVGSLLACQLGNLGYRITLFERRPDARKAGFVGGRSINLALSCRGISALDRIGIADRVLSDSIRMPGRMLHDTKGRLTFQAYSSNTENAIHSVSRSQLNLILLEEADTLPTVTVKFDSKCVHADLSAPAIFVQDTQTENASPLRIGADYIIGCDGAFSAVRGAMQKQDRFSYSQQYLEHGFKELVIPPAQQCGVDPMLHDGFAMDPHALHIWPRGHYMMIALPNADRSFTCTLFWPFNGPESFAELADKAAVLPFFQDHFPDAAALMPTLEMDYLSNPVGSLVTVRCSPWHASGKVLLLGDAAHAVVPFYGQGMNCGFEDCRLLADLIEDNHCDLDAAFVRFSDERIPNANTIADLAIENFTEMRDSVANPIFQLRKRIEHSLHALDSEKYKPLYNLVSFSNMPYAEARTVGSKIISLAQEFVDMIGLDVGRTLSDEQLSCRIAELIASRELPI